MKIRSAAALTSAFLAGLLLAVSIHTALATGPSENPPSGNISPRFYGLDVDSSVTAQELRAVNQLAVGLSVSDDKVSTIKPSATIFPVNDNDLAVYAWDLNAAPGSGAIFGGVSRDENVVADAGSYLGFIDFDDNAWGLYADNTFTTDSFVDGTLYVNSILADDAYLKITSAGGVQVVGDMAVDGTLTATDIGLFSVSTESINSDDSATSVTAVCEGTENDIAIACSGYSTVNDFRGARRTTATECTAYRDSTDGNLIVEAYCFDPSGGEGFKQASGSSQIDIVPIAPTGLTASASGTDTISLNWNDNPASDIDHYVIYRSTSSSGTYSYVSTSTVSSFLNNAGLSSGTTYYYKVSAVDAANQESDLSSSASATTSADTSGGTSSFVAGTKILTQFGPKNIEDLVVGDKVLSYDTTTHSLKIVSVVETRVRSSDHYYLINNTLKVTAEHPLAVKNGDQIIWKKVKDIAIGDLLVTPEEASVAVRFMQRYDLSTPVNVFNPSIGSPNTYFVLLDSLTPVLVHNKVTGGSNGGTLDTSDEGGFTGPGQVQGP